jgi:cytoskeletal protein RodZ
MTARHQLRIGSRRIGRARSVIDATPAPGVGEMLYAARERKGVDLYRAERDTKIRLKYLEALEDGDYEQLPPPVYTKGFLRNYALYLGLEPEEVINRWREESLGARKTEKVVVVPPPQPLVAPRRGMAITPGLLVGLMLSAALLAFIGYIGWQVLRFADAPVIRLTHPASQTSEIDAESVTMTGTAGPSARIRIMAASGESYTTVADANGAWSREVPLSKGRNDFSIIARDAVTERDSDSLPVIISVPLPVASASPSVAPTTSTISLGLTSPLSGASSADGQVTVSGTTSGTRITIDAEYLGPLSGASPAPTAAAVTPSPSAGGSPAPSPTAALPRDITVPFGGAFSDTLTLAEGRWRIIVTSYATGLEPVEQSRLVTIEAASVIGTGAMTLVITAEGGGSWLRIVGDGEVLRPGTWGGPTLRNGSSVTVNADTEIWLRAGNAGVLHIVLNGVDLGMLGDRGDVGNWIFEPGQPPRQTTEQR